MNTPELIDKGNEYRSLHQPAKALECYAQAMVQDPESFSAFNNYGNVMREIGFPRRGLPFLQYALELNPTNVTAKFNIAISYLLMGDYERGWPAYETRWQYEHLNGTEPKFSQPRWTGEDLSGKTILVVGEQGHGDNIQFIRFLVDLHSRGAKILLQVTNALIPLLSRTPIINRVEPYGTDMGEFDYWVPIMSLPGVLGVTLDKIPLVQNYLTADPDQIKVWQERLGPKYKMRVGFAWTGRKDSWLNQHKSVPFEVMLEMIKANPQYEWINLQIDGSEAEELALAEAGVSRFPGTVASFADSAALMMNLDVVIGVDSANSHLAGALGRPTWIMLNNYATDWRWLVDRDSSPWYSTVRLFRQPSMGDWRSVTKKIGQYLSWFKI
jgi:hypothetical protein